MAPSVLNFITGNANKLAEVRSILSQTGVEVQSQNVDVPELQGTIEEISRAKCEAAAKIVRVMLQYDFARSKHTADVENQGGRASAGGGYVLVL